MDKTLQKLSEMALKHGKMGQSVEVFPEVSLYVSSGTTCPITSLYQPMFCLVLQGIKEVTIGNNVIHYGAGEYFINSVDLPISSRILEADDDHPYMAITMILDPDTLADVVTEVKVLPGGERCGYAVTSANQALLDPWLRLFDLVQHPEDRSFLLPMLRKEILYRLFQGPQQQLLRQIAGGDNRIIKVRHAIDYIRRHFTETLAMQQLADLSGMSIASFHRHFRASTGMTPLQYQKTLRLQEARKRLVNGHEVGETAYEVGYESPSQFSREYSRMFSRSPSEDAKRLRSLGATAEVISHAPW